MYKTYEEPEFDKDGKYISKRIKKVHLNNDQQIGDNDNLDIE